MAKRTKRRTKSKSTGRKTSKVKTSKKSAKPELVEVAKVPGSDSEQIPEKDWLKTLIQWMIEGQNSFNIREAMTLLMTADPQRQGKLWEQAWAFLLESGKSPPAQLRSWCIEAAKDVYRKLLDVGDYVGALKAVMDIHKVFYRPRTPRGGRKDRSSD